MHPFLPRLLYGCSWWWSEFLSVNCCESSDNTSLVKAHSSFHLIVSPLNVYHVLENTWRDSIWGSIQTPLASTTMEIISSQKLPLYPYRVKTRPGSYWSLALSSPIFYLLHPFSPNFSTSFQDIWIFNRSSLSCPESQSQQICTMLGWHKKPSYLRSRKRDVEPNHKDVRTQGSFSESLISVCACRLSFNSSLPLKVLVYLLF